MAAQILAKELGPPHRKGKTHGTGEDEGLAIDHTETNLTMGGGKRERVTEGRKEPTGAQA